MPCFLLASHYWWTEMNRKSVVSALHSVSLRLGYSHPKPDQEKVVVEFVLGRDVFLSLPTGYGNIFVTVACHWFLT